MNKGSIKLPVDLHKASVANSLLSAVNILSELVKIRITIMVTLTTALGYILGITTGFSAQVLAGLFFTVTGIFLLAASASVLNHYQERAYDALMDRTANRPIPSGRIRPGTALLISFLLLLSGSAVLLAFSTVSALLIGLITMFWYNFVYTPLKRKTAFAIIPGAIVGALPPLAGWAGASENIFDPGIIIVALFFFVWQIPHFWLLLILFGRDYEKAGYPTLQHHFNDIQLKNITFMWILASVFTAVFIQFFGIINYLITDIMLMVFSALMIIAAFQFLRISGNKANKNTINTFVKLNFYTLLVITLLSADKLIKLI